MNDANVFQHARTALDLTQNWLRVHPPRPNQKIERLEAPVIYDTPALTDGMRNAITHVLSYALETARAANTRICANPVSNLVLIRPEDYEKVFDAQVAARIEEFSAMLRSGWRASASGGKAIHVKEFPSGREQWACPRVKAMINGLGSDWGRANKRHGVHADAVPTFLKVTGPLDGQVAVLQQLGAEI